MRLWIFHHYATLPTMNGAIRPYCLGKHMKSRYETTIFCASHQHFSGNNLILNDELFYRDDRFEIPYVFIKTCSSKNGGFERLRNMCQYSLRLMRVTEKYAQSYGAPDIIIASSPHPLTLIAGIEIAKKFQIPCIGEIRDLLPENLFASTTKVKRKSLLGRLLVRGEHWIYRYADGIIFTKEGDMEYIKEMGWDSRSGGDIDLDKCEYINNGVDLQNYDIDMNNQKIDDPDLQSDTFRVTYAGAIRATNDVTGILDAAKLLQSHKDIRFLIYGEGNMTDDIRRKIEKDDIANVKLKGFIERKYIPYLLSKSSVNLLNYSPVKYNWSRGCSSNKLFEYMASGKPILSTVKTGHSIIEKYRCGIELTEATPEALASAIAAIRNMPPDEYRRLGENARKGAEDFDYAKLAGKLEMVIEGFLKKRPSKSIQPQFCGMSTLFI